MSCAGSYIQTFVYLNTCIFTNLPQTTAYVPHITTYLPQLPQFEVKCGKIYPELEVNYNLSLKKIPKGKKLHQQS